MNKATAPVLPFRLQPNQTTPEKRKAQIEKMSKEFESLLMAQLIKIMRRSVGKGGLFPEAPGSEIYSEMMDQEVARALSMDGGLGLARQLEDFFLKHSASPSKPQNNVTEASSQLRVTSDMGWRKDPFTGEWKYHKGVDLAAAEGTPVLSAEPGTVIFSGREKGYGNTIEVEGDDGIRIRYAHLRSLNVQSGEQIKRNQQVGEVGHTGRATGPHLHLEMSRGNRLIDPFVVLTRSAQVGDSETKVFGQSDDTNTESTRTISSKDGSL